MPKALVLGLLCAAAFPAAAQLVKCVDERGRTHYADNPEKFPPGCKAADVQIQPQPPIWGELKPKDEDLEKAERDFQAREARRRQEEEAATIARAAEQRRCDRARAQLALASAQRRVPDTETHEANLKKLNAEVAQCKK